MIQSLQLKVPLPFNLKLFQLRDLLSHFQVFHFTRDAFVSLSARFECILQLLQVVLQHSFKRFVLNRLVLPSLCVCILLQIQTLIFLKHF
jgi:hypothetical protein